jgi:hypothetical protein
MKKTTTIPAVYSRVTLIEFCNWKGIHENAGPSDVTRATKQPATLGTFYPWNSTYNPNIFNVIVLALIKYGQLLTNQTGGPAKLAAPDFANNSQFEQVAMQRPAANSKEITSQLHLAG